MLYTIVLTYQSLCTPCSGEPRLVAECTVAMTHASTTMYNFEFTAPPKQVRMEEWIVHAHSKGDGFDLTANLTLSCLLRSGIESPRRIPITWPISHVANMQLLLSTVMTAQRSNINFVSRSGLSRDVFRRTHRRLYRLILCARKCRSASLNASRNNRAVHTYAGPVSRSAGSLFSLNGHTMSQACCTSSVVSLSGSGEYLVRMARDVALSTASNLEKRSSGSLPCTSAEHFGGKASGIGRY